MFEKCFEYNIEDKRKQHTHQCTTLFFANIHIMRKNAVIGYFAPGRNVLRSACTSVFCLSALISQKPYSRISQIFTLLVAMARSSSDSNAIYFILLVLWMTSCFHMERMSQNQKTTRMFSPVRQVAVPAAKSAVSDCILYCQCSGNVIISVHNFVAVYCDVQ